MLMRFDPFRELDRLTQQAWGPQRSVLPMDAYRRGDQFVVSFDLPGVDADSIDLTVEKNVLTVKAERRPSRIEGDELLASERPHGSFTRQLFLSEALDTDAIQADYRDGVLTVTIPIAERAKARKVAVGHGDGTADGAGVGVGAGVAKAVEAHSTDTTQAA
jgi:HSP20 family protein